MLKRKIDKYLEEWKASIDKKPLIVRGAPLHLNTLHLTPYTTPHYTTLHHTTPYYTTLHNPTPSYTTLHNPTPLLLHRYSTATQPLHHPTPSYTTPPYTTLPPPRRFFVFSPQKLAQFEKKL